MEENLKHLKYKEYNHAHLKPDSIRSILPKNRSFYQIEIPLSEKKSIKFKGLDWNKSNMRSKFSIHYLLISDR